MKKEIERPGWIYVLHNCANDKEYVGQTVRGVEIRWADHIKAAFRDNDQRPLYRAMRKSKREYGRVNFTVGTVWTGLESKLNAAEIRTIRQRKTFIDTGWGYNLTTGGGQFKMSKRTIRKLRKIAQKRSSTPEFKAWASDIQLADWAKPGAKKRRKRTRTAEEIRIANITKALRRPSVRKRLSDANKDSYANDPTRVIRLSDSLKVANAADPSIAKKRGLKLRGKKRSKAAKAKNSAITTAQWADPVAREKKLEGLRRGSKRRWARESEICKAVKRTTILWTDSAFRKKTTTAIGRGHATPEYRVRASEAAIKCCAERRERLALNNAS